MPGAAGGLAVAPARAGARLTAWALRLGLTLVLVALAAALALSLRLAQGPIEMPWLAAVVADEFNSGGRSLQIKVDNLILAAGAGDRTAGLELTGVDVADQVGVPLLSVPRLSARLDLVELLTGGLKPTEITVEGATARLVRTEDGRFRFALRGASGEAATVTNPSGLGRNMDAAARLVEGFVGERTPLPQLSGLRRITIANADLTYVNAQLGRSWRSDSANLTLRRTDEGAALELHLALISDRAGRRITGAALELTAERRRGATETAVQARFRNFRPEHLVEEVPSLGWLAAVDAPLSGRLDGTLADDGTVGALSGELAAADGTLLALEADGMPFDRFALDFAYEPELRRMRVDRLAIAAPAAGLALSGFADLDLDAEGRARGVAAQLDIADLRLDLPEVFAEEQRFDGGQIVARLDLDSRIVEVAEARLAQGPLTLSVQGRAMPAEDGWTTDLRVTGEDIAVERLVSLWPLPAAEGARSWLAEHLRTGTVDELLGQIRFGRGEPMVNLDFRYSGLATSYLDDMSVIRQAAGQGHLTWRDFTLTVEEGRVEPVEGQPIYLGGSVVRFPDISARPAPAEITIRGKGPSAAVLALIDQQPLGLVSKLDLDPGSVGGTAEVETVLRLPLKKGLKVEEVEAEATARLRDTTMPFALDLTGPMRIAARRLDLVADNQDMTVTGDITADGTPIRLAWEERYGGGNKGRDIRLTGRVTPDQLAAANIAIPGFEGGRAAVDLDIAQARGAPTRLNLSADLTQAAVAVDPVYWSKPPGAAAQVSASGTYGARLALDAFAFSGPGLEAEGSVQLFPAGGVERARIERLVLEDVLDLTVDVAASGAGFDLDVGGRWFDLAFFERSPGDAPPPLTPLAGSYAVDQVKLSERITLGLVDGDFVRLANGRLEAALTGQVAGTAPVSINYTSAQGEPGRARVTADDAGRVLEAAGLFSGAVGGDLTLEATIPSDAAVGLWGTARIRDVRMRREAQTFRRVLEEGELGEAAAEAEKRGIGFNRVVVPFAIRGERIEIGTALATSPSLAVKLTGVVDEATRGLDLRGVISPAYALTGALNRIPVLGALLGGEGEGILAMTFSVSGSVEDPAISVNPLSLLAPGFLRNLFEGGAFEQVGPPPHAPQGGPPTDAPEAGPPTADAARAASRVRQAPVPPPRTAEQEPGTDARQAARLRDFLGTDF